MRGIQVETAGITLFWLGVLAVLTGAIAWVVAYRQSRQAELASMSPDQKAWQESETAHRAAVRSAEKGHKSTAGAEAQSLRAAQETLTIA